MKERIRNMFPGGNTSKGFYSYYEHVLPQSEAVRIFCLKGGPGTGKSTLMKEIGDHFYAKGEQIEFMWCSSDPASIDGVVLKERGAAVVDGTSPHIVDPVYPGVTDQIVDIGRFWDQKELNKNRERIIECSQNIKQAFQMAYMYFGCAGEKYKMMADLLDRIVSEEIFRELKQQLNMKIDGISVVRRAENKIIRGLAVGSAAKLGKCRKLFAGALTSDGIKSELLSITKNGRKIIALDLPAGYRSERLLKPLSLRLREASFDVEQYYCPMDPESKIDHIVCPDIGLAVITCNNFHGIKESDTDQRVISIGMDLTGEMISICGEAYQHMCEGSREDIHRGLRYLALAKAYHDELEGYYIPAMDFERIGEVKDEIIRKIENMARQR